jgi:hypothetical protein
MATSAMTALATITLGTAQATVTFSSISGAYRDLRLVVNANSTALNGSILVRLNADAGNNYSYVVAEGNGATPASTAGTDTYMDFNANYLTLNSTTPTVLTLDLLDYSATDKHKTALTRVSSSAQDVTMAATRWANTAAVTTLVVYAGGATFAIGSSFTLYGIAA